MTDAPTEPALRQVPNRVGAGQLNVSLPIDLLDALDRYCAANDLVKRSVVEVCLKKYLREKGAL